MTTYFYKGEWEAKSYKTGDAVLYSSSYYVATDNPQSIHVPGIDTDYWSVLPEYSYEDNISIVLSREGLIENSVYILSDDNGLGLFKFPYKNKLISKDYLVIGGENITYNYDNIYVNDIAIEDVHFHKMGVEMVMDIAKEYYEANKATMPNITGIYIMQGERQVNVVTQGFSIAGVSGVGLNISGEASTGHIEIDQFIKLGTNSNDVVFPILGGSDYRMFPVIKVARGRKDTDPIWRMEEDGASEVMVANNGDAHYMTGVESTSSFISAYSPLKITPSNLSLRQKDIYDNIKNNRYCLFTPDILLNKGLSIPSNAYIKPVVIIDDNVGTSLGMTLTMNYYERKYGSMLSVSKLFSNHVYAHLNDERYKNYNKDKYIPVGEYGNPLRSIYSADTSIVMSNVIASDNGFSTRMKSIIEVFGDDYKTGVDANQSNTLTQFMASNREELFDAGVLINRTRWSASDNLSGDVIITDYSYFYIENHGLFPFNFPGNNPVYGYNADRDNNAVLQPMTNMSMTSLPYIGIKMPLEGKYSSVATGFSYSQHMADSGIEENYADNDYRGLHNAIVNVCKYKNDDEYYLNILAEFNRKAEQYSIIDYNDSWNKNENLVIDSNRDVSTNDELVARYNLSEELDVYTTYTIIIKGHIGNNTTPFRIFTNNGIGPHLTPSYDSENDYWYYTGGLNNDINLDLRVVYIYQGDVNLEPTVIEWIKIIKGDTFDGYSKAPFDNFIYRGDVYSQKTFMRVVRWNELPEVLITPDKSWDWSYAWKAGQAFNIYLQSFTNSFLRLVDDDTMYYPYVISKYNSIQEAIDNFIWKNGSKRYLEESWRTNDGLMEHSGSLKLYGYSELLNERSDKAANRIYASNVHIGGSVVDQYRVIPMLQYKDYNFEGGEIMALCKLRNNLFSIQRNGINQHYPTQQLLQSEDSSTIITGETNILSDKYRQLASYGTQHRESVIEGTLGVYGVDWNKEKIWRIKQEVGSQGGVYFIADDLAMSKSVYDIFSIIKKNKSTLDRNIYKTITGKMDARGIVSSHDIERGEIIFTFLIGYDSVKNSYESYTIIFSELLDAFVGFVDYKSNIYMPHGNRVLSFTQGDTLNKKNLWEHNAGDYLRIYGDKKPMELEFVINCGSEQQNASQFEKEFHSHMINSSSEKFSIVSWETEYQTSEKNPFVSDGTMFWSDPQYREHVWEVPVAKADNSSNKGPTGTNDFESFEKYSSMRGQWMKVRLKYVPLANKNVQFYIRNIITNFIISY